MKNTQWQGFLSCLNLADWYCPNEFRKLTFMSSLQEISEELVLGEGEGAGSSLGLTAAFNCVLVQTES